VHDILNRHASKIKVSSELAENVDMVSYMQDKTSTSYPSYSASAITRTYVVVAGSTTVGNTAAAHMMVRRSMTIIAA
jgi:glucose dehydrogenase